MKLLSSALEVPSAAKPSCGGKSRATWPIDILLSGSRALVIHNGLFQNQGSFSSLLGDSDPASMAHFNRPLTKLTWYRVQVSGLDLLRLLRHVCSGLDDCPYV